MFKGPLEVGKEYELNNGEVHKCQKMFGADPKAKSEAGFGPFIIDGCCYQENGVFGTGAINDKNVRGPAVGTLAELDVKPGDVVRHVVYWDGRIDVLQGHLIINAALGISKSGVVIFGPETGSTFRIISRAEHTAEPTVFGELTDAEKGALLLANHGGQGVQAHINGRLLDVDMYSILADDVAYRVKPKPVVETVVMSGSNYGGFHRAERVADTHRLTFDVIDGDLTNPRFEVIK